MSRNWLAVASADHVKVGLKGGFMQVCHGKGGPLNRLAPGDKVVYYSPLEELGGKNICRSFTALGLVKSGLPYQFDMGGGFMPFRRDVLWLTAQAAPIRPLLNQLDFSAGLKNWGYKLRLGFFSISDHDISLIAAAMGAEFPEA